MSLAPVVRSMSMVPSRETIARVTLSVGYDGVTDGLLCRLPTELITAILVEFSDAKMQHAHLYIKNVVAAVHITRAAFGKVWPQPD